ncbi:AraC family transcriptional regulator [Pedobacter africanus]|uniref:YesN/AraC family two-component response regulator n=1 Tax=Pedobacter africanus TaxID=151894 RepID=A0ACC6KT84_9SPHI|nr:helix-turn-helix domain-containing protein [Pedobacter africanus]MDR6782354.1 YesN/AraC family two-component response regulator [Pedobacter africanus]
MKRNHKLLVKGMVCNRCITVLSDELSKLGLDISSINLGEVILKESNKTPFDEKTLKIVLQKNGFDLLYDKNEQLISQIKLAVERGINEQSETGSPVKFSKLISEELHRDYNSLSAIFSLTQGNTLEKYIILRKIEKVKGLLVYTDQSLTNIANIMGYSSVAYLSRQLKQYTGFDFAYYKRIRRDKLAVIQRSLKHRNQ